MSLICVFDKDYTINTKHELIDELQKLIYCRHVKNVIIETGTTTDAGNITDAGNNSESITTTDLNNTNYIFPTIINEETQVFKIKEYIQKQSVNVVDGPIILLITPNNPTNTSLEKRLEITNYNKVLNIKCPHKNIKTLIQLLQTMYFGNVKLVDKIYAGPEDASYYEILKNKLDRKYGKLLRNLSQLPNSSASGEIESARIPVAPLHTQPTEDKINIIIDTSRHPKYINELENYILINYPRDSFTTNGAGITEEAPKQGEIIIDFFSVKADKHPDFKGMETGDMPAKQNFQAESSKLAIDKGIKEIEKQRHSLEKERQEVLKKIKESEQELIDLDKEYARQQPHKEVLDLVIELQKLPTQEEKEQKYKEKIRAKFDFERCQNINKDYKYVDFVNSQNHLKISDITNININEEGQAEIDKRLKQLDCFGKKSEAYNFISLYIAYDIRKEWIKKKLNQDRDKLRKLENQIALLKGKENTDENIDNDTGSIETINITTRTIKKTDNIQKAINQLPTMKARYQELENKNKECHREHKTRHHWKYTIKRDKEYREACDLQDKIKKLENIQKDRLDIQRNNLRNHQYKISAVG